MCYEERQKVLKLLHRARNSSNTEILKQYNEKRRHYKKLLREKRASHLEKEAQQLIKFAMDGPFTALKTTRPSFPNMIQMQIWVDHFREILNQSRSDAALPVQSNHHPIFPKITEQEILAAIMGTKTRKAAGSDGIANEHLKLAAPHLIQTWTQLFNKCLEYGTILEKWRHSTIKVLYKGKGATSLPDAYRGIALENPLFKVFSKVLTKRLYDLTDKRIPGRGEPPCMP